MNILHTINDSLHPGTLPTLAIVPVVLIACLLARSLGSIVRQMIREAKSDLKRHERHMEFQRKKLHEGERY